MPHRPRKPAAAPIPGGDDLDLPSDFSDYKVAALPIISNFCQELGVTRMVDGVIDSPENISSGQVVVGMVMDTLSGRSPLYKLHEYFAGQDMGLLFGTDLEPSDFNDNNVGKVLDNIHAFGASNLFTMISWEACRKHGLDRGRLHYDTTSVSVHGDYDAYQTPAEDTIAVTHGHSKDRRPDLKQFMMEALCIQGSVPLLGSALSGNTSDKKANNVELSRIASLMKKHGLDPKAHIYIADSASITEENLILIEANGQHFISRLPAIYKEERRAVDAAFEADNWTEAGILALHEDPSAKRPSARYKVAETTVALHGAEYRAVVVHSSAHDKRRLKKLDKELAADREAFRKLAKELEKTYFACPADARRRADELCGKSGLKHHDLQPRIVDDPVYQRGRPKKGRPRKIKTRRHRIEAGLSARDEQIEGIRERSGCFVLISNLPTDAEEENAHDATGILKSYKEQYGIEMNFRFLKDPLIVNDTFLKKAERIEALGFILLLSLMVWNLMQHLIRTHIKERETTILGWDNKQTRAPTTLMVIHYFQHVSVFTWNQGRRRRLSRPLKEHQKHYLAAIGLPESIFTIPVKTYRN